MGYRLGCPNYHARGACGGEGAHVAAECRYEILRSTATRAGASASHDEAPAGAQTGSVTSQPRDAKWSLFTLQWDCGSHGTRPPVAVSPPTHPSRDVAAAMQRLVRAAVLHWLFRSSAAVRPSQH